MLLSSWYILDQFRSAALQPEHFCLLTRPPFHLHDVGALNGVVSLAREARSEVRAGCK